MIKLIVILFMAIPFVMTSQMTYVPDDKFEQALIDLGYDSGPLNDSVPTINIDTVKILRIEDKRIYNFTGLEAFIALEELRITNNGAVSLDVSKNKALKVLYCNYNSLDNLDLTKNLNLEELSCIGNNIISLDLSNNTRLAKLDCSGYSLTNLYLGKNTALVNLNCSGNPLTSLDLRNNLLLRELVCYGNLLKNLDLSKNSYLEKVNCSHNQIMSMDFSMNTELVNLDCSSNQLSSMDFSMNTELVNLDCSNNQLTALDISKNSVLEGLNAKENNNLFCIRVFDSSQAANKNNWHKDAIAIYSEDCSNVDINMTYIPDDKFEQALISKGYDSGPLNDSVLTKNIIKITHLSLKYENIKNLTGIESFISLEVLRCSYNMLDTLDFSKNTALKILECQYNNITNVDIAKNKALEEFNCWFNPIKNFDLSKNSALIFFNCAYTQITSLDLNKNSKLKRLVCSNNNLTSLDLSHNPDLQWLNIQDNPKLKCIQVIDSSQAANNPDWWKDSTAIYSEDCTTVSVDEGIVISNEITISPNPASDYLTISTYQEIDKIDIYSALGLKVGVHCNEPLQNRSIDVSGLPPGVYFVRIGNKVSKFIKI